MELQKHRIATNIGVDQNITIELKQNFDILEILSLKFSQTDVYRIFSVFFTYSKCRPVAIYNQRELPTTKNKNHMAVYLYWEFKKNHQRGDTHKNDQNTF